MLLQFWRVHLEQWKRNKEVPIINAQYLSMPLINFHLLIWLHLKIDYDGKLFEKETKTNFLPPFKQILHIHYFIKTLKRQQDEDKLKRSSNCKE